MPKEPQIKNEEAGIYRFASLEQYSFKQRLAIRLIDLVLYSVIYVIGKTIRFEPIYGWTDLDVEGYESFEKAEESGKGGIIAFWHDRIFLSTFFWRRYDAAVMVSKSFDGEYITRTAQRFGYGVIRGSSSRGGSNALAQMIRLVQDGSRMVFTVDGPRGPRHKVKKGAIVLAKESGLPIGPMNIACKKYWTVKSWDKTQIPKPFTKAAIFVAEPVFVDRDADRETIESKRVELESKLDELVLRGQEWRDSLN